MLSARIEVSGPWHAFSEYEHIKFAFVLRAHSGWVRGRMPPVKAKRWRFDLVTRGQLYCTGSDPRSNRDFAVKSWKPAAAPTASCAMVTAGDECSGRPLHFRCNTTEPLLGHVSANSRFCNPESAGPLRAVLDFGERNRVPGASIAAVTRPTWCRKPRNTWYGNQCAGLALTRLQIKDRCSFGANQRGCVPPLEVEELASAVAMRARHRRFKTLVGMPVKYLNWRIAPASAALRQSLSSIAGVLAMVRRCVQFAFKRWESPGRYRPRDRRSHKPN
jgi:hypothetical protein